MFEVYTNPRFSKYKMEPVGTFAVAGTVTRRYEYVPIIYTFADRLSFPKWTDQKFNNFNMALMLVEIMFEKGLVNDATYSAIRKKHHVIDDYNKERNVHYA